MILHPNISTMAGDKYLNFRKLIGMDGMDRTNKIVHSSPILFSKFRAGMSMSFCDVMMLNESQENRSKGLSLHLAVRNGNETVVEMLLNENSCIETKRKSMKILPLVTCRTKSLESHKTFIHQRDDFINYVYTFRETPLHVAVKNNNERIVRLLLDHGADVNAEANNFKTPLHYAIECKYREIAKILLRRGAYLNARIKNGLSALHLAVRTKDHKMVRLLLKYGVNVNTVDGSGVTPLYMAFICECYEITKLLLGAGAIANGPLYFGGETMLNDAVHYKDEKMVKFLLEKGAYIHLKNKDGKCPLHIAVESRSDEIVKMLLKEGANVNHVTDLSGQTILHIALKSTKNEKIIGLLLDYGANFDAKNSNGKSPWNFAAEYKSTNANLIEMFLRKGASVDERITWGTTALHNAVGVAAEDTVKILLKYGADVNARDDTGKSALHYASGNLFKSNLFGRFRDIGNFEEMQSRFERIIELLLERGASIDSRDNNGDTSLYDAAISGHQGIVKLLLAHGASRSVEKILPIMLCTDCKDDLYTECEKEIVRMKSDNIYGNITFYDILRKRRNELIACVRNESIVEAFTSNGCQYKEKYPIYSDMLSDRFRTAVEEQTLRESAEVALNFSVQMVLPYLVTKKIFSYLSATDLKSLVSVFHKSKKSDVDLDCKKRYDCQSCKRRNTFSIADKTPRPQLRKPRLKRITWL